MADDPSPTVPLFLYGTLRTGGPRHDLVAPYLVARRPARVWGRLYAVPEGYPALELPGESIFRHGTDNPAYDARTASTLSVAIQEAPPGWQWIAGDWVLLTSPERALPPIDDYEGYFPETERLYARVLTVVDVECAPHLAWTYIKAPAARDTLLPDGIWYP